MTDTTTLCLGGPLDGHYRTIPNGCISFRVTKPLRPGESAGGRVADDSVEYQLVWSREHNRMVWWAEGEVE